MTIPFISLQHISKHYQIGRQKISAIQDLSLDIFKGEIVGLAGGSGSGKTTLGKILARLIDPAEGVFLFEGQNIFQIPAKQMRALRRRIQIVLQDPYGSLNPRLTIREIIGEGLKIHGIEPGSIIEETLETVGLPHSFLDRLPASLSGGQRQRVSIARALVLKPDFLIFDESVSALDITHQRQITTLLKNLREERNLTYLFILHDLNVLKFISDRIGIMHNGQIIELEPSNEIMTAPKHLYTQALISSIPIPDPIQEKLRIKKIQAQAGLRIE